MSGFCDGSGIGIDGTAGRTETATGVRCICFEIPDLMFGGKGRIVCFRGCPHCWKLETPTWGNRGTVL